MYTSPSKQNSYEKSTILLEPAFSKTQAWTKSSVYSLWDINGWGGGEGEGTHILGQTVMCCCNGSLFYKKILQDGSQFYNKILKHGSNFFD